MRASLAFARQTQPNTIRHARGHIHLQVFGVARAPAAVAVAAFVLNHLPTALAVRAGAAHAEKPLPELHRAAAVAGATRHWARALFRPAAITRGAADGGGEAHTRRGAMKRLSQRHLKVIAQIPPARRARAPRGLPPAAKQTAHQVFKQVFKARAIKAFLLTKPTTLPTTRARPLTCPGPTRLKGRLAKAVIGRALLRVFQHLIGLVNLLKLRLRLGIPRVAVRVELHRFLAVGALQRAFVRPLGHAQQLIILVGHSAVFPKKIIHPAPWSRRESTAAWSCGRAGGRGACRCTAAVRVSAPAPNAGLSPPDTAPSLRGAAC